MVTALVLFTVARGNVNEVGEQLASIKGVSEVYSVGGRFDLVARIKVQTNDEMADLVTGQMQLIEGILSTETLIAFRAYSRSDMESMFSLGMDE